jgi:hypothetical protein
MKTRTFTTAISITALFLLNGCLEHAYHISVLPDNRLEAEFKLRGDRTDMEDGYDMLPDSVSWGLTRSIEEKKDETTYIVEGKRIIAKPSELTSLFYWSRQPLDSLSLKQHFRLESHWNPIGTIWRFEGRFSSREFDNTYGNMWDYIPPECRALEDKDKAESFTAAETKVLEKQFALGVIQWNRVRFERMFDRVWEIMKLRSKDLPDTSATSFSIIRTAWSDDLHRYMNSLDIPEPEMANTNWWKDLRPQFLGRFADILSTDKVITAGEVGDAIEREYQISKDIEDDQYIVKLKIPGKILKSDGQSKDGEQVWEIKGKALLNQNVNMLAVSFQFSIWRLVLLAIILIAFIDWSIRSVIRKRAKQV